MNATIQRTRPFTDEELRGQFITMPAIYFQQIWQALQIIEDRLHVEDGCVDYRTDPDLGEVHRNLMVAAVCSGERSTNRILAEAIQQGVMARDKNGLQS